MARACFIFISQLLGHCKKPASLRQEAFMKLRNHVAVCQKKVYQIQEGIIRQDSSTGIKEFACSSLRVHRSRARLWLQLGWWGSSINVGSMWHQGRKPAPPALEVTSLFFSLFPQQLEGIRTTARCVIVHLGSPG